MRTSSNRNPSGFHSDSNDNGFRVEAGSGRVSSSRGSSYKNHKQRQRYKEWKPDEEEGMLPWSERRKDLFEWADRNLPDQHPALVVVAIIAIRMGGEKPTKDRVLERLRATGREASQIGYGPGGYAA